MEDNEEGWQEISHSILANLSEDIRLFIFPKKTELYVRLAVGKEKVQTTGKYAISPEFEELSKVPVCKSHFQVKLVQLLYGGLPNKQKSNDKVQIRKMQFSTGQNRKGQITVLRYTPIGDMDTTPAVLFFHGGADLFPALPYHYKLAEKIAVGASCRVFLVMHDLAPKFNPPVQIKEGLDIYRQLVEEAEYFVDHKKIVIMGDSSGGTMAAAVALLARDGLAPMPAGQMLLYPSLDMRYNTPSMEKYVDVPIVNTEAINCYRKIVQTDWSKGNKYYLSPTEADSFKGLCSTYIETAEFDALHDEGVEYARKLEAAGVPVILNETKGTVHSFDMADDSSILARAVTKRIDFLKGIFNK
jgi:acetyl esterase/lipase